MKITVINGTQNKGCTYKMKDMFLSALGTGHEVTEFNLPNDLPVFCSGCKVCFLKDITACPHRGYTNPIWNSLKAADLIVITSSVYVFGMTAEVKAMLDHFGTKWMAHSPDKDMFLKKAVIITNCVGQGTKNVINTVGVNLDFWGVAKRYAIKESLFYVDWDKVSGKKKASIKKQCEKVAKKVQKPVKKPRFKVRFFFWVMKLTHKTFIHNKLKKDGEQDTKDYMYWKEQGWFDSKKPWKNR